MSTITKPQNYIWAILFDLNQNQTNYQNLVKFSNK